MGEEASLFQKYGEDVRKIADELKITEKTEVLRKYSRFVAAEAAVLYSKYRKEGKFPLCLCSLSPNMLRKAQKIETVEYTEEGMVFIFSMKDTQAGMFKKVMLNCICSGKYQINWEGTMHTKFVSLMVDLKYRSLYVSRYSSDLFRADEDKVDSAYDASENENSDTSEEHMRKEAAKIRANPQYQKIINLLESDQEMSKEESTTYNTLIKNLRTPPTPKK